MLQDLPSTFCELQNLEKLILNSNQLSSIPQFVGQLPRLTVLIANSNQIETIPEELASMHELFILRVDLKNLKTLWLANNKISGFYFGWLLILELGPRCSDVLLQREDVKEVFFVCLVFHVNARVIRFLIKLFVSRKRTEFITN